MAASSPNWTVPQVVAILREIGTQNTYKVLEQYRQHVPGKPDAFREFASEAEMPLLQVRAELCACHTMLGPKAGPSEEEMDAIGHLVAASYNKLDQIIALHRKAHVDARAGRGAA